jgi:hypothetical protein
MAKEYRHEASHPGRPETDQIAWPRAGPQVHQPGADVLPEEVLGIAAREGPDSFAAPAATCTHCGSQCTLEVLIEEARHLSPAASTLPHIEKSCRH